MAFDTPVVFLIYNRSDLTAQALSAISRVQPRKLFVVGDGPKVERPGDDQRVASTRAVIDIVDWPCEVVTNYSNVNLGLKRRVSSGLDWAFDQVDEAIVIEDDCVADPSFFSFCREMLDRYRDDQHVLSIGGANFQEHVTPSPYSYYFSKYFRCWGWASWRRAWRHFDVTMRDWPAWKSNGGLRTFSASRTEERYWRKAFDACRAGQIESWAYAFSLACFRQGGLHVQPAVNLVSNLGFREDATNTPHPGHRFANYPAKSLGEIQHPPEVTRDEAADRYTFADVYDDFRPPRWKRLMTSFRKRLRPVPEGWQTVQRLRRRLRLQSRVRREDHRRIIVGASGTGCPGWIATDQKELNLLDPRDWRFQFREESVDAILAEHVWEHLSAEDGFVAAEMCFRYLKPGGYLRVAVPDGLHPDPTYIEWVRPLGHGPGAEDHRVLYTHDTFRELFRRAGFTVRLLEYFDDHGAFHGEDWDASSGMIHRSRRFDRRNADGTLRYTSIILDAVKPDSEDATRGRAKIAA